MACLIQKALETSEYSWNALALGVAKEDFSMILGMIDVTSHDGNNLWDVEGQVPDDSKNNNITKEEDEIVNLFSNLAISIHDLVCKSIKYS